MQNAKIGTTPTKRSVGKIGRRLVKPNFHADFFFFGARFGDAVKLLEKMTTGRNRREIWILVRRRPAGDSYFRAPSPAVSSATPPKRSFSSRFFSREMSRRGTPAALAKMQKLKKLNRNRQSSRKRRHHKHRAPANIGSGNSLSFISDLLTVRDRQAL